MKITKRFKLQLILVFAVFLLLCSVSGCGIFGDNLNDLFDQSVDIQVDSNHYDVWDGSVATSFKDGNGTKNNPYQISSGSELAYLASLVNEANEDYNKAYYCLVNSIDLNGHEWTPIGWSKYVRINSHTRYYAYCFYGVFDGKNCVVKNLKITDNGSLTMVGLFGDLNEGTIKNLGVMGEIDSSCDTTAGYYVGGLVGWNHDGLIENCFVSGSVAFTSTTSDCYVGGITACNNGTIRNCFVVGDIDATYRAKVTYGMSNYKDAYAGGIAANNNGKIENCFFRGDVYAFSSNEWAIAGGIAGSSSDEIANTFADGSVYAGSYNYRDLINDETTYTDSYGGGLVGILYGSIINSFSMADVSVKASHNINAGRIIGYSNVNNVSESNYFAENNELNCSGYIYSDINKNICNAGTAKAESTFSNSALIDMLGWNADIWNIQDGNLPYLTELPKAYSVLFKGLNIIEYFVDIADNCELLGYEARVYNKDGYEFNGWVNDITGALISDNTGLFNNSVILNSDIEFTPKMTTITYTAEFIADKTVVSTVPFTIEDNKITEPVVPEKNGYEGYWENYSINANNLSINAVYTPIEYNITYIADDVSNSNITSYTVESDTIQLIDVSKSGYTFGGWYLDEQYSTPITQIEKGSFGDLTVYAQFVSNEYELILNSNGGTQFETMQIVFGEPYNLPVPSLTGYDFLGWKINGYYVTDNLGNSIDSWNYVGSRTALAQWEETQFTITYHNCKDVTHDNITAYTINDNDYNLTSLSKDGYEFLGWFTDEDHKNQIEIIEPSQCANYDLYAAWDIIQYNISYLNTKGFDNNNPTTYNIESDEIELLNIGQDGITSIGWYIGDEQVSIIPAGSIGDISLSARWNNNTYAIKLSNCETDVWDGTTVSSDFFSGTGTKDDPYIINSAAQFVYFLKSSNSYSGIYIELNNNIDLNSVTLNTGKSIFSGYLDGNNFKITNVVINSSSSYAGLFNKLSGSGCISNLIVDINLDCNGKTAVVGGLAGIILGNSEDDAFTVKNVKVTGAVNLIYNDDASTLTGGGVFGDVKYANISYVEALVNVAVQNETTSIKSGAGYTYKNYFGNTYTYGAYYTIAGGFAGEIFNSNIQCCKSEGVVNSIITRTGTSSSKGSDESYDRRAVCGGFAGFAGNSTFEKCYAVCDIKAKSEVINYYMNTSSYRCYSRADIICAGFIASNSDGNSFYIGAFSASYCYFDGSIDCYGYSAAAGDKSSSGSTNYNYERTYVDCAGFSSSNTDITNCSVKASINIRSYKQGNITSVPENDSACATFYPVSFGNGGNNNKHCLTSLSIEATKEQTSYSNSTYCSSETVFSDFTAFDGWQLVEGRYEIIYDYDIKYPVSYGGDFKLPVLLNNNFKGWYAVIDGIEQAITDAQGNSLQNSACISEDIIVYPKYE